ncbi:hypothetical protein Zm00014a_020969 [Zea mays]|uniref:Uncharacterized protein n=1 Tax=Zea mays TaxID=4577 RepID=A0A3L6G5A9_MAIZE|nr:hypothetical protein Zm00014a_020969 [Zea mays]
MLVTQFAKVTCHHIGIRDIT